MTEREAGAQPLLYSELDVNDLFCNSEKKNSSLYISSLYITVCVIGFLEVVDHRAVFILSAEQ